MAYLRTLVAGLLAGFAVAAHAGYAQLAAPAGFSQAGSGTFTYAANAANDMTYGRIVHQANGLTSTVAGQPVKMAAAYRLAANAPRVAARAIFLNPWVAGGIGIAAWLASSRVTWNQEKNAWEHETDVQREGVRYRVYLNSTDGYTQWVASISQACGIAAVAMTSGDFAYAYLNHQVTGSGSFNCTFSETYKGQRNPDLNKGGESRVVPYIEPQLNPVSTPDDLARILNPDNQVGWPMPDSVPLELPPNTPLPVEQPFINPAPSANPAHRPLFVPTGNPVPNPNYNPNEAPSPTNQPYIQPGVRVVPSPTPSSPWQVDLQPVDRPVESSDPNPEPQPEGEPNDGDKPRDDAPDKSLCEQHPDILACQKLGGVVPEVLASNKVPLSFDKDEGFGPENGACPAPKQFTVLGKQMAFQWDLICDFASGIRPLLVGFAYLSAALAFLGLSRREG